MPGCVDGVVTGCILSVGRILGESAALLFTAGFAHALNGFWRGLHSAGATLTVALYVYAKEQGEFGVAFAIAAILMVLALLINLAASLVSPLFQEEECTMNSIITVKDLNLWYGGHQALTNISIDIPEKSITALIGPSGCGKSHIPQNAQPYERPGPRREDRRARCDVSTGRTSTRPARTSTACAARSAWCSRSRIPSP